MPKPHRDSTWSARRAAAEAEARLGRLRVCAGCGRATDEVVGRVHSELPCDRCGAKPCYGSIVIVVAGASAAVIGGP